jgi:hypothetical protein
MSITVVALSSRDRAGRTAAYTAFAGS